MNFMNDADRLRSNMPNVPTNPITIAYIPNSTCPIRLMIIGVRIKGENNPNICAMK